MASTANMRQRARNPRRTSSPASAGDGSECTVKASGVSGAARDPGADELEPDIQTCHQRTEGEPLEGIAVVLVDVDRRARPVARQTVVVEAAVLDHRKRRQGDAGLGGVCGQVDILTDRAGGGRRELEEPGGRRGE